ncbi:MAG TPA: RNA polymerase sigma factor [Streptosporangiaceae bacterium]
MSPPDPPDTDAELLRAIAAGDENALGVLYDRHAGWLLARLRRRCAAADLVDQTLQDTFLTVWRGARGYRGQGEVPAFLWGIAIRRLVDTLRRDGRAAQAVRAALRAPADSQLVASAEDEVLLGIEHGRLGDALTRLSPELRTAIEATVLDGLTCAEAGLLLGVPAGTIKSRCHRARIELREALT